MEIKPLMNFELEDILNVPVLPSDSVYGYFPSGVFVCNTTESWTPGEHWVSIYIDSKRRGQFFDSLGEPPSYYGFDDFMNYNCINGWGFNDIRVQDISSNACGYHCIYFCISKQMNISLDKMFQFYSNDLLLNDFKVVKWTNMVWGGNFML